MALQTYLTYLAVVAVFFAAPPGPNQLLMISSSVTHGLRRSLAAAAGMLLASALQMAAAAFGLAALLAGSGAALLIVKWVGVGYLAWLGLSMMFASPAASGAARARPAQRLALLRRGFVVSGSNPPAILFFTALFPQFIDPSSPVGHQLLVLGLTFLAVEAAMLLLWGAAADYLAARAGRALGRWLARIGGALMLCAAALLAGNDMPTRAPAD